MSFGREYMFAFFSFTHTMNVVYPQVVCVKKILPTLYLVPIPMATINWSNELLVLPQLSNERGKIRTKTTGTQ